ncbi:centriolar coiled-coil protein of 110 kDa [Elysia marginata]|uniref:Centriolar coiled-coil protein of 110 kDa n=1 Tax=Elysia marginata TaxID=1093978 RepID=A0AAV4H4A0_9GAST|nr:centriolar coiled-coil protein of 110 kDa [Elysia marginata]
MGEASPEGQSASASLRGLLCTVAGEFGQSQAGTRSVSVSVQQLSHSVSITLLKVMVGSPAGMGQLIKYFESQSKRLDKQSLVPQVSCLNSDFESMIKFNGVPILPPAMTSSRRGELLQLKKSAMLLEKRHKARQRRQIMPKADGPSTERKLTFPETSPRPAARQLNFDSDMDRREDMPERLGATNPVSTLATAETGMGGEDFGLQTMDSVNSDFMSMDHGSIPKVFAGLALTSFKEQKISYDLDRLSRVLNVQDMASTSGSDVSDALGNTQTLGEDDLQDAQRLAQKFLHSNADGKGGHTTGFFHESQDTVVEVSPEPGTREDLSTSGFVDNTASSNLEHTQTSLGSSPGCGSANTTGTTDSQRSNRSSPKSLKNAVHFASFLTEYNTTTSQLFERPTIVKKKMPYEQSVDHAVPDISSEAVVPIIGDPAEARQRLAHKSSEGDTRSNPLLNRVALNPDSDSSPVTPPFDPTSGMPFQSYGKSEPYSSDKENDASNSKSASGLGHKKSPERSGRPSSKDQTSPDMSHRWASQRRAHEKRFPSAVSPDTLVRGYKSDDSSGRSPHSPTEWQAHPHSIQITGATCGVGPQHLPSHVDQSSAGPACLPATSNADLALSLVTLSTGVVSVGQTSVSDSQGSNKSATLTGGTSESSSSTIKDDLSARDSSNLAMNIVVTGHGSVNIDTAQQEKGCSGSIPKCDVNRDKNEKPTKGTSEASLSPKKLNTDIIANSSDERNHFQEQGETPPRQFVRKGSYTLSEPSPALIKARARYHEETSKQTIPVCAGMPKKIEVEAHGGDSTSNNIQAAGEAQRVQRKLPNVTTDCSKAQADHSKGNTSSLSGSHEAEREGKAEHINKYLSQVQFQNSMNLSCQSWDGANQAAGTMSHDVSQNQHPSEKKEQIGGDESMSQALELLGSEDSITEHSSMLDVLKSLAESVQGSRDTTGSVTELLSLHQQQMDQERQALIQQQERDMEELFVQQRRDMLLLEAEIKAAQQFEKEQQEFLIENLPENIKVKARNYDGEYSPEHTGTFKQDSFSGGGPAVDATGRQESPSDHIHSLDNRRPQSHHHHNHHQHRSAVSANNNNVEKNLQLQPKSFPGAVSAKMVQRAKKVSPYPLLKKGKVSPYSPRSAWDESQTQVKTVSDDSFSPRDGPMSIAVPGYSPSTSSPRFHRPLMLRSPLKYSTQHRRDMRISIPPEVHTPEMQAKFAKVSAVAKGFLTRCLLQSDKVQELVKTIKDTREFAFKFQTETPVKKGVFTPQDRSLLERIVAQLQAALLDVHEIFFEIPCGERMALIEQTRNKEFGKRVKMSKDSLRGSGPRVSQATLKALERKRKAKEAEASVVSTARPRTAPPSNNSPRCQNHTDVSGPLRRHFGFLISRALKPLQGQGHHHPEVTVGTRQDPARSDKERPRTAPVKQLTRPKRITALSSKQMNNPSTSSSETIRESPKQGLSKSSSAAATKVVSKTKGASVKPVSNRPGKSWR